MANVPNVPEMAKQFFEFARSRGLKQTEQRRAIVETFLHSHGHLGIEELLERVRQEHPRIGYATVYRTLRLLIECGLANARHFGDGLTRYELADAEHHDHLICSTCGKIVEFKNDEIEELQEAVAREHGFAIHSHKMELYGLCASCQKVGRQADTRPGPRGSSGADGAS
jgi:Fur family ferric uptake transcriptional regulator